MIDARAVDYNGSKDQGAEVKVGSNRTFGVTVGGIFAAIGAAKLLANSHGSMLGAATLAFGSALFFAGLAMPAILGGLNLLWMRLGLLLSKVTTPIVMAILFFLFVTPLALLMRVCGARPLDLKFNRSAPTYWKRREGRGFKPSSLERQF